MSENVGRKKATRSITEDKLPIFRERFSELCDTPEFKMNGKFNYSAIAKFIGDDIPSNTIKNYLEGVRVAQADMAIKISKAFNVSIDYLFGISDVKSVDANLKAVCKYTGLSEGAVINLANMDAIASAMRCREDYEEYDTVADLEGTLQDLLSSFDIYRIAAALSVVAKKCADLEWLIESAKSDNGNSVYNLEDDIELQLFRDQLYMKNKAFKYSVYELSESTRVLAENWFDIIGLSEKCFDTITRVDREIKRRQEEALDNGQEEL